MCFYQFLILNANLVCPCCQNKNNNLFLSCIILRNTNDKSGVMFSIEWISSEHVSVFVCLVRCVPKLDCANHSQHAIVS